MNHCVFTIRTPVPVGLDRFSMKQGHRILNTGRTNFIERAKGSHDGMLNMTYIALRFAGYEMRAGSGCNVSRLHHWTLLRTPCSHSLALYFSAGF